MPSAPDPAQTPPLLDAQVHVQAEALVGIGKSKAAPGASLTPRFSTSAVKMISSLGAACSGVDDVVTDRSVTEASMSMATASSSASTATKAAWSPSMEPAVKVDWSTPETREPSRGDMVPSVAS